MSDFIYSFPQKILSLPLEHEMQVEHVFKQIVLAVIHLKLVLAMFLVQVLNYLPRSYQLDLEAVFISFFLRLFYLLFQMPYLLAKVVEFLSVFVYLGFCENVVVFSVVDLVFLFFAKQVETKSLFL